MKIFLLFLLMTLAGLGFVLCPICHFMVFFDVLDLEEFAWNMFWGIFIVWGPAILVAGSMAQGRPPKDIWCLALRGCPPWMMQVFSRFVGLVCLYSFLATLVFCFAIPFRGQQLGNIFIALFIQCGVAGLSAVSMAFFAMAFAIFYSSLAVNKGRRGCIR